MLARFVRIVLLNQILNIMKKLLAMATVVVVLLSCTTSRVSMPYERNPNYSQRSFYYYPSANVYYDGSCNNYLYQNGRSWVSASVLPRGYYIGNQPRYQVYYRGPEVWRDNDRHRNMYYRQPPVVYDDRYDGDRDHHRHHDQRYYGH